jgi:DNA-binding HxlR family transcriptional regulator
MKSEKLYPNDKKILLHLASQDKKVNWLDRKEFSMNEKTFWNRVKYLEDCKYVGVIRHAGLKNLYFLTPKGEEAIQIENEINDLTAKIFDLSDFRR